MNAWHNSIENGMDHKVGKTIDVGDFMSQNQDLFISRQMETFLYFFHAAFRHAITRTMLETVWTKGGRASPSLCVTRKLS